MKFIMEYDKIKQLMDDMGNSKLTSIDIEFPDGIKIKMTKDEVNMVKLQNEVLQNNSDNNMTVEKETTSSIRVDKQDEIINNQSSNIKNNTQNELNSNIEEKQNIVKSPMVGTFYLRPSPNANPYVEEGKKVKKGDVLCIIEAMKLMNEIESECDGEIAEIYVKDGETVEYGKPLFRII